MRKILFLDIDGVINNRESMMAEGGSVFRVSKTCTDRLRALVEVLDIKLVLSSTWRFGGAGYRPGFMRAKDAMADVGWSRIPFIGFTPDLTRPEQSGIHLARERGDECNVWVKRHGRPGDVYVAVDDDGDFSRFVGTLVRTDHEPGLTDDDVEAIREAFKKGGAA